MSNFFYNFAHSVMMWSAWILIPFLMEFIPAVRSLFIIHNRKKKFKKKEEIKFYPDITLIVPVYHSKDTLYECLMSINEADYPNENIQVLVVNNDPDGESFHAFTYAQDDFPTLHIQWLDSKQGKSKALNLALYNAKGKYIINVDSDGVFHKDALKNMIEKFESNNDIACMTGTVLTNVNMIKAQKKTPHHLLCILEFMEYAQAFLAGRSYLADSNDIYTLSGAFSAFRKDMILSSRLYNTNTISEDTQMTFQMKYLFNGKIEICEDAIFFVDPIEDLNTLYTQRQRWQRGALEVSKMFIDKASIFSSFKDENVTTLLYDHTFAFPRIIWYIVTIYFIIAGYNRAVMIKSVIFLYIMYTLICFFYYFNASIYLKVSPTTRKFYRSHFWAVFLLPLYNFMVFFFRISGFVNSVNTDSSWKALNFKEENQKIKSQVRKDLGIYEEER